MTTIQAIVIALLQGMTELFPVSSLGHAVILPPLLGWTIDQHAPSFLPFLVVLHVGTAIALLVYFWNDWIDLFLAVIGMGKPDRRAGDLRVLLLLVVATVPAVMMGFVFNKALRELFAAPLIAALFLTLNGVLLLVGERLRRSAGTLKIGEIGVVDAVLIGGWQCTALFPGISRSGATMVGGLLVGLSHAESARFSFLLATPIILGAAALEVPKMLHSDSGGFTTLSLIAGVIAGLTAYASVVFLMRYFKTNEIKALNPFGYYCLGAGLLTALWFGLQ